MSSEFVRNGFILAAALLSGIGVGNPQNASPSGTATSIASAEARIIPPSPSYHFPANKTLLYGVDWHAFNAGTATIQLRPDGTTEKLNAAANSSGTINLFFPVHDWFEAHFDPKTFCSSRVFKHSEEGKRNREVHIQVDYERRKSVLDEKNLRTGESKHEENDAPACATDIVSGFFYVASLPLQTGSASYFPVSDGGKTSVAVVRVEGRDQVKVPAGTFHAIRVSVEAASGKLQGKGKLWVWFSDDAEHMPLQMQGKMGWGSVMFKLQKVGE
jgi:hypothetical protein